MYMVSPISQTTKPLTNSAHRLQEKLINVIRKKDFDLCKALIDENADVNKPDTNGFIPLIMASARQDERIVSMLLAKNADPNLSTSNGRTALHGANLTITSMLLHYKANINQQAYAYGETPLAHAVSSNKTDVVALLIQNNADANIPNSNGETVWRHNESTHGKSLLHSK